MSLSLPGNQVSTTWLADHLHAPDLAVVDASWYLPAENRNAHAEYLRAHIPRAVYFDIDRIADTNSGLPHTLAKPEQFASAMGALGIGTHMTIVVYDGAGLFSAARVWWTFKTFGVENVAVLRGGLPRWRSEGRSLENGVAAMPPNTSFDPSIRSGVVANAADVLEAVQHRSAQIIDARSGSRFRGEAAEPRPGVRPGHIPASCNLHYAELIADGELLAPALLEQRFLAAGVAIDQPIITTCGSGVTAAILTLALAELGRDPGRLYDGSWSEWGSRADLPIG